MQLRRGRGETYLLECVYEAEQYSSRFGSADHHRDVGELARLRPLTKVGGHYGSAVQPYFSEAGSRRSGTVHRDWNLYPSSGDEGHYQSGDVEGRRQCSQHTRWTGFSRSHSRLRRRDNLGESSQWVRRIVGGWIRDDNGGRS